MKRIVIDKGGPMGLRDKIVGEVSRLIFDGHLAAGTKLPSCRALAADLDVSINTVIGAYDKLIQRQLVVSKARSGYFVASDVDSHGRADGERGAASGAALVSLNERVNDLRLHNSVATIARPIDWRRYPYPFVCNQIDDDSFPVNEWRECMRLAMGRDKMRLWYSDGEYADSEELIEQVCARILPRRGLFMTPDRVLITLGSQNGLYLTAAILGGRERIAAMEEPGYPDARKILQSAFGGVRHIPVDDEGLVVDERLNGVSLVYVTPNRQFPTTVTMSERRRRDLIAAAEEFDFFILEDDYECDVDYRSSPPLPLYKIAISERVIYLASLSKGLAPGLRLGYLIASDKLIELARDYRGMMMRHPPIILQQTSALFLRFGHYESLLKRTHQTYLERWHVANEAISEFISEFVVKGEYGGTNFMLNSKNRCVFASSIAKNAINNGIVVEETLPCYFEKSQGLYAFRIGVSAVPKNRIPEGIKMLSGVIKSIRENKGVGTGNVV